MTVITREMVLEEWVNDASDFRDNFDPIKHSKETPHLHSKYYGYMLNIDSQKTKLETKRRKWANILTDYYNGDLGIEEMKKYNFNISGKKYLKADVQRLVENDNSMIAIIEEIGNLNTTIKFVEDIIKELRSRTYQINNAITFEKFRSGA